MKGQNRNRANEAGTSLIELIMVIVITGILAAAAVYRYKGDSSVLQQRNAAKVALNDLRLAQELALTHGKAVRIEVDLSQNLYAFKWDQTNKYLKNPIGKGNFVRKFGKDEFLHVQLTATDLPNGKMVFSSAGKPFVNGNLLQTVKMVLKFNNQYKIIVFPYSGNIKLESNA